MPIDDSIIGPRKCVRAASGGLIGIAVDRFRAEEPLEPTPADLSAYSRNPRNAYGDWYQRRVEEILGAHPRRDRWQVCTADEWRPLMARYRSVVYTSRKIPDLVVRDVASTKYLGLELKYLHGTGSLIKPKTFCDAVDFTHRPFDCIYVIDGPGWKRDGNVDYLAAWWQFASAGTLTGELHRYFEATS